MAKIKLHPTILSAQGKMASAVFRRSHTGEMTLIKLADMSKVKWSKAQKEHRRRFKAAVAYAKAATHRVGMAEPKVRAVYEKSAKKRKSAPSIWPSQIISRAGICCQRREIKESKTATEITEKRRDLKAFSQSSLCTLWRQGFSCGSIERRP